MYIEWLCTAGLFTRNVPNSRSIYMLWVYAITHIKTIEIYTSQHNSCRACCYRPFSIPVIFVAISIYSLLFFLPSFSLVFTLCIQHVKRVVREGIWRASKFSLNSHKMRQKNEAKVVFMWKLNTKKRGYSRMCLATIFASHCTRFHINTRKP